MAASRNTPEGTNRKRSPHYGALQDVVDALFAAASEIPESTDPVQAALAAAGMVAGVGPNYKVSRLDVVLAAESADLPEDLLEIVLLLPPGAYTRQRLCTQLNSAIAGHAWGQVYGTVA